MRSSRPAKIFITVFLSLFACGGVVLAIEGFKIVLQALQSKSWPVTESLVLKSEVASRRVKRHTNYEPIIRYSYQVGDARYVGSRLRFVTQYSRSLESANRDVGHYPANQTVKVAYNPSAPSESVLEPGLTKHSFIGVIGGLGFASFALAMLTLINVKNETIGKRVFLLLFVGAAVWIGLMMYLLG